MKYNLQCQAQKSVGCWRTIEVETDQSPSGFTDLWLMEIFNKNRPKEKQWVCPTSEDYSSIHCPECFKGFRWPSQTYNREIHGLDLNDQISLTMFLAENLQECDHTVHDGQDNRSRLCKQWAEQNGLEYDNILKMYDTVLGWPNCDCEALAGLRHRLNLECPCRQCRKR